MQRAENWLDKIDRLAIAYHSKMLLHGIPKKKAKNRAAIQPLGFPNDLVSIIRAFFNLSKSQILSN